MKKYQHLLSEFFHFLLVKFLVYMNRRVFVMIIQLRDISIHNKTKCVHCVCVCVCFYLSWLTSHRTLLVYVLIYTGYLLFCCEYHKYCHRV